MLDYITGEKACQALKKSFIFFFKQKPALLFNPGPVWGAWTNWTSCSATCGTGSQQRMRTCAAGACVGHTTESQACTGPICESFASVVLVLRTSVCSIKWRTDMGWVGKRFAYRVTHGIFIHKHNDIPLPWHYVDIFKLSKSKIGMLSFGLMKKQWFDEHAIATWSLKLSRFCISGSMSSMSHSFIACIHPQVLFGVTGVRGVHALWHVEAVCRLAIGRVKRECVSDQHRKHSPVTWQHVVSYDITVIAEIFVHIKIPYSSVR